MHCGSGWDSMRQQHLRHYRWSGLNLESELACPELLETDPVGPPDVTIRLVHASGAAAGDYCRFKDDTMELGIDGVARFRIMRSREITIEPAPRAAEGTVRLFLLGSVMGALCHLRNLFPLHASAIAHQGECMAFVGPSGSGKSTIATMLAARGYPLISDDICVLNSGPCQTIRACPASPALKLWADTLHALGRNPSRCVREVAGVEKYLVAVESGFYTEPLPLRQIHLLVESEGGGAIRIAPVSTNKSLRIILANVYRPEFAVAAGRMDALFSTSVQVASTISVFSVCRPKNYERMNEVLERLEEAWAR